MALSAATVEVARILRERFPTVAHGETQGRVMEVAQEIAAIFKRPVQATVDEFDVFWHKYPRKEAKQAARKAWLKLKPDELLAGKILNAVDAQAAYLMRNGRNYCPHAATWLNAGRWDDEVGLVGGGFTGGSVKPLRREAWGDVEGVVDL